MFMSAWVNVGSTNTRNTEKNIKSKFSLKLLRVLLFVIVKKYTTVQKFEVSLYFKKHWHIIIVIFLKLQ